MDWWREEFIAAGFLEFVMRDVVETTAARVEHRRDGHSQQDELSTNAEIKRHVVDFERAQAVIEQAKGITMATVRSSPEAALLLLVKRSQQENCKLRDIAADIVRITSTQPRPAPVARTR